MDFGIGETAVAASAAADATASAAAAADVGVAAASAADVGGSIAAADAAATATAAEAAGGAGAGLAWGQALAGAGTILSAATKVSSGYQASAADTFAANQANQEANSAAASGQRAANTDTQQAALLQSRARAVAAASGGSSTDPTNVMNDANIGAAGEYKALTDMYEGNTKAEQYSTQAKVYQYEAGQAVPAGWIGGAGSILQGSSSLFSRYAQNYG